MHIHDPERKVKINIHVIKDKTERMLLGTLRSNHYQAVTNKALVCEYFSGTRFPPWLQPQTVCGCLVKRRTR